MRTINNLPPTTILLLTLISLVRANPSATVDQDYTNPDEPPKSPIGDKPNDLFGDKTNDLFGDSSIGSFPDIDKLKEKMYGFMKEQMGTTMKELSPDLSPDLTQQQDKVQELLSFKPDDLSKEELIRNSKKLQELGRTVIKLISDKESNQMTCDDKGKDQPKYDIIKPIPTEVNNSKEKYQPTPPSTGKYDNNDGNKYGDPPSTESPTTPPKPITPPSQTPYESLPHCTPEMIKKNYAALPTLEKETKYPDLSSYINKYGDKPDKPYGTSGGYPVTPLPDKGSGKYGTPPPPSSLPPKNQNMGYSKEVIPTTRCQLPKSIDQPKETKPKYDTKLPKKNKPKYETKPPSSGYDNKPPSSGYDTKPPSSGYDTKPPSSGYDTKPPSYGKSQYNTEPPSTGYNTKPSKSKY